MEIWKDIIGYEGLYQVSNFGNVKSFWFGKETILKQPLCKGYCQVSLYKDKKTKTIQVHQLVAIHFLNHKPDGFKLVINHIDFNIRNNNVENLEIVTPRQNTNQKHLKSSSKYVGVYWHKQMKKWAACILINKKSKHLGFFKIEYDAHLAYEKELSNL